MILIWHEGALGDLLLSRLAIGALQKFGLPLVLCARHEARTLFQEAGVVEEARPTSLSLLRHFSDAQKVFVFTSQSAWAEIFYHHFGERVYLVPTRPLPGQHLAWQALKMIGGPPQTFTLSLSSPPPRTKGLVVLHPGSGGSYKCAPSGFWKEVYQFLEALGKRPLVFLGPAERDLFPSFYGYRTHVSEDIAQTVEVLCQAEGFLGHDSGLTHLAAALGLPVWGLFGPTDWRAWAPFGGPVVLSVRACRCLKEGKDPRKCLSPCLKGLVLEDVLPELWQWFGFLTEDFTPGGRVLLR